MRQIETGHYPIKFQTLPSSWAVVSVGEALSEIQPGFACGIHNRDGIGIPHIRPMNIDRTGRLDLTVLKYVSAENELRLHSGDVLFNNTNSAELIGKTTYIGIDAELAFSNHMTRLRPANGVDSRFIAYQLHFLWMTGYFQHRCTHHVNQASVASSTLADSVPLIIAPTVEQRHIVAEIEKQFTRLDAAVVALKRVQANLKRYRASVLKAACEGRLVPTEAELARREGRSYEPASVLLERILAERRCRWQAAYSARSRDLAQQRNNATKYQEPDPPDTRDLPQVPVGWVWATAEQLSDETRAITYGVIKLGEEMETGIPTLRSSDVRHLRLDLDGVKKISLDIARNYRRTFLRGGEVLVTVRGTLGGVVVAPPSCDGYNISREVAMLAPLDEEVGPIIAFFIGSTQLQNWLLRRTKGIAYTGINIETLKRLPIPLPPRDEQTRLTAEIARRLSIIEEIEAQALTSLARAERVRQSVLKSAFEGRLIRQNPNDEPASTLLERIRSTANLGCAPVRARGNKPSRHVPVSKETANV